MTFFSMTDCLNNIMIVVHLSTTIIGRKEKKQFLGLKAAGETITSLSLQPAWV